MEHLPVSDVREHLADILNRVVYQNRQVVLQRHGRDMAALISMRDLDRLRRLALPSESLENELPEGRWPGCMDSDAEDPDPTPFAADGVVWEKIESDLGL